MGNGIEAARKQCTVFLSFLSKTVVTQRDALGHTVVGVDFLQWDQSGKLSDPQQKWC